MAYCIDATVYAVQAALPEPFLNPRPAEAEGQQLLVSDHSVLALGEVGNEVIDWRGGFPFHCQGKGATPAEFAPLTGAFAP